MLQSMELQRSDTTERLTLTDCFYKTVYVDTVLPSCFLSTFGHAP